jgi:hypothetical protein
LPFEPTKAEERPTKSPQPQPSATGGVHEDLRGFVGHDPTGRFMASAVF